MEPVDNILKFWFGRVEETIVPSAHRAKIWFSDSVDVDKQIITEFRGVLDDVIDNESSIWMSTPRGMLAKIIVLDQFSRHIHRNAAEAFENDRRALEACLQGLRQEDDHQLSLIERVFFYFPLLHSEQLVYQEQAVIAFTVLSELAFDETKIIYDSFLKFANHHYTIIQRFNRFPQRNGVLGRTSTPDELEYLAELTNEEQQDLDI
jgi:uncharacterized protein (DUF924 family)